MVYVQQVGVEKSMDREKYINNKAKTGMSLGNRKVVRISYNSRNRTGMHHHRLVHLRLATELNIIIRTPKLGQHIHRVVWRKEVVSLLPMPSVVEIAPAYVVKALWVVSSEVKSNIL